MLERKDLWSLEEYSENRAAFKAEVIAHKKHRHVELNEHGRLLFEDEKTIRYQIQEMLRIEKVFESAGIQEELDGQVAVEHVGVGVRLAQAGSHHGVVPLLPLRRPRRFDQRLPAGRGMKTGQIGDETDHESSG